MLHMRDKLLHRVEYTLVQLVKLVTYSTEVIVPKPFEHDPVASASFLIHSQDCARDRLTDIYIYVYRGGVNTFMVPTYSIILYFEFYIYINTCTHYMYSFTKQITVYNKIT